MTDFYTEIMEGDEQVYLQACADLCAHEDCVRFRNTVDELHMADHGQPFYGAANPIGLPQQVVEPVAHVEMGPPSSTRYFRSCNHHDRFGGRRSDRRNGFRKLCYLAMKVEFPALVGGKLRKFTTSDLEAMRRRLDAMMREHGMRPQHRAFELNVIMALVVSPSPDEIEARMLLQSRAVQMPAKQTRRGARVWDFERLGCCSYPVARELYTAVQEA